MRRAIRAAALALAFGTSACGGSSSSPAPAPVGLAYHDSPAVYTAGLPIAPNDPTTSGGPVDGFAISPALPPGLLMSATTGRISGTPTAAAAMATYTITASNSGGSASTGLSITVSVPAAPHIAIQPRTQVVALDEAASFAVVASGTGTLTYQWFRDGVAVAGQTQATLITEPVTYLDDDARYTVVVTDRFGGSVASVLAKVRLEGFIEGGAMSTARQGHAASRLPAGGKVLITGGFAVYLLATAELYDPVSDTVEVTGALVTPRQNHTSSVLADGRVLLVGGQGGVGGGVALESAEIYTPATGTFMPGGSMAAARTFHAATVLADGTVLVTGGLFDALDRSILATAETYDPATGSFSPTGSMSAARYWHTATLLPNGKVLIVGGFGLGGDAVAGAELYDPVTRTFADTGAPSAPRYGHSATLLVAEGQVLVAGGYGGGLVGAAELYDPVAGTFATTGALVTPRHFHSATALPGGQVLLAGGLTEAAALESAELFDPVFGSFQATGAMEVERSLHTATLLETGEVLVAGGWSMSDAGLASTELFSGLPVAP